MSSELHMHPYTPRGSEGFAGHTTFSSDLHVSIVQDPALGLALVLASE